MKYRDAGMRTYTYFWINEKSITSSPYFDTDTEALNWFDRIVKIGNRNDFDRFESSDDFESDDANKLKRIKSDR